MSDTIRMPRKATTPMLDAAQDAVGAGSGMSWRNRTPQSVFAQAYDAMVSQVVGAMTDDADGIDVPPTPSVTRLDWSPERLSRRQKAPKFWYADTPVGMYSIELKKKFWLNRPMPDRGGRAYFDTLDEAMRAGQDDLVGRISACLATVPGDASAPRRGENP